MVFPESFPRQSLNSALLLACTLLASLIVPIVVSRGQQGRVDLLRIGATGTLTGDADSRKEKTGLETLRRFIKEETGLNNEIVGQKTWQEVSAQMAKGQFHIGVFQGYEFAWAQDKYPEMKALALGINLDRYPVACVVVQRDNKAKDFAGLKGQSFSLPTTNQSFLRLFVDRQREAISNKEELFFSKFTSPDNVEDALDDVVDGQVQATLVDRAALEAYRQRKPGRFNRLKVLARSQAFPPLVVASYGSVLDQATLQRFKDGLLSARRKEKGDMLLTLSRLTGFENIPDDFSRVVDETRKAYPPSNLRED